MHSLNERFDENVNLAMLDGGQVVYLDSVPSTRLLGVRTTLGSRAPAHCTAVGKSLLAQLDDAGALDHLGAPPYEQRTDKTIRTWRKMRQELAGIRKSGLSRSFEEFEPGLAAFATVVGGSGGGVKLALSIAVPAARLCPERTRAIELALLAGPYAWRSEDDGVVA